VRTLPRGRGSAPRPARRGVVGAAANELLSGWYASERGERSSWLVDLLHESALIDATLEGLARKLDGEISMRVYTAAHERETGGWRRVQRHLRGMRDLLAADGAGFGVVLLPAMARRGGALASRDAYRVVSAFCEREGIPCFDPEPLFDGAFELRGCPDDAPRPRVRDAEHNTTATLVGDCHAVPNEFVEVVAIRSLLELKTCPFWGRKDAAKLLRGHRGVSALASNSAKS